MKVNLLSRLLLFVSILSIASCKFGQKTIETEKEIVKTSTKRPNIILLIGDGMGLTQVSSAFYFQDNLSNFARFKHIGLIKTSSTSHKITDSAAGATAFACGKKSYNSAIGVSSDSSKIENISEILSAKDYNYQTGLVATSSITHATPAAFYAHQVSRNLPYKIAQDMIHSPIDFFAGGGRQFFRPIYKDLVNKGFRLDTGQFLASVETYEKGKKYGYLSADDGMPMMTEGRGSFLSEATFSALRYFGLNNDNFFLMVEGSQIDWGGHANDATYIINEMKDFDQTIGRVLDFAKKDGNTLVIITADHETGGFALSGKNNINSEGKTKSDYNIIDPSFSTGGHTATLIPVFAYGPGAEEFQGIYDNNEIFHKILKVVNSEY